MKLVIAYTPNGQRIHIVAQLKTVEATTNLGMVEFTACQIPLDDLDSPEPGEHRIAYQSVPPLEHFNMCPNCKWIYEDEHRALLEWNQRVLRK